MSIDETQSGYLLPTLSRPSYLLPFGLADCRIHLRMPRPSRASVLRAVGALLCLCVQRKLLCADLQQASSASPEFSGYTASASASSTLNLWTGTMLRLPAPPIAWGCSPTVSLALKSPRVHADIGAPSPLPYYLLPPPPPGLISVSHPHPPPPPFLLLPPCMPPPSFTTSIALPTNHSPLSSEVYPRQGYTSSSSRSSSIYTTLAYGVPTGDSQVLITITTHLTVSSPPVSG